ncbi:uncharacterized protein N7459_005471 [Penicillium hispanicum]|uniref:uncharacterized protein n=1 Tax=Penicillium hispanicum TaxID=1080232 RepID=UPI002541869C|nr:uncharacterized protein N7459_005471 [Penicillium hispanicum]KAJ5579486.1 hypothetical protein N7459_005471 [Penicillium hispanicum]
MSAILKSYLGFGRTAGAETLESDHTPLPALAASWYTSQEMSELERRAVFSRKWLLTTHKLRLPNTGDYLQYDIAGFPFILCRDREGNINAFHNVCRHRAFPVVTEQKGTARIFSCKYHGWSYGLNGKLAKAPGYQDLEGFDKSQNGLFPIHVHVDTNGFVWLNLDAAEKPEFAWEDECNVIDPQSQFHDFNSEDYKFDHSWDMEGAHNWKLLADHYDGSYHSQAAHADGSQDGNSTDYASASPEQLAHSLKAATTFHFPNASMTASPQLFFMQRLVPTSPTSCSMRFEVYRHNSLSDKEFESVSQAYKRLVSEAKDLCIDTQKTLDAGILANEDLHRFQVAVRDLILEHHKREEQAGRQIWPSRQALPAQASTSQDDVDFCANLTTQSKAGADCSTQAGGCCGGGCAQAGNEALAY